MSISPDHHEKAMQESSVMDLFGPLESFNPEFNLLPLNSKVESLMERILVCASQATSGIVGDVERKKLRREIDECGGRCRAKARKYFGPIMVQ